MDHDEQTYKRGAPRVNFSPEVTIAAGDNLFQARLRNLSVDGAAAVLDEGEVFPGESVQMTIPKVGTYKGTVVRYDAPTSHIQFDGLTAGQKEQIADFLQVRRMLFR